MQIYMEVPILEIPEQLEVKWGGLSIARDEGEARTGPWDSDVWFYPQVARDLGQVS